MSRRRPSRPAAPQPAALPPWLLPVLLVPAVWFAIQASAFLPHTVDDAWITFRYSRQWSLGHGPYFNPGEHVEGYSNLSLMMLVTPVVALAGPEAALPLAKAVGFASGLLAIAGAHVLGRRAARAARVPSPWSDSIGLCAGALVAFAPGFALNATSGLETALYSGLLVWGVIGIGGTTPGARVPGFLALAAAGVTRPEGPLCFAVGAAFTAVSWLRSRGSAPRETALVSSREVVVMLLIGLVVIGGQMLFRHLAYDGEWLPNTWFAKAGGSGDRWTYVREAAPAAFLGLAGVTAAALGWLAGPRADRGTLLAGTLGVLGAVLPFATGADWMPGHRLVAPYLPLLAPVVACGWYRLAARAARGIAPWANTALVLATAAAFGAQAPERTTLLEGARTEAAGVRTGHAALADWLAGTARPGDAIVLMDIGLVGYRCIQQRIVDVTGLTDRHIAKSPGTFMAKSFDLGYVFERKPAFIVLTFFGREGRGGIADARAPLYPFSDMESRLAQHPEFAAHYFAPASSTDRARDELAALAAMLGAERLFPYAVPGKRYVLAVYRRHE